MTQLLIRRELGMCQDLSSLYLRGNKHPFTKLISYFRVLSGCQGFDCQLIWWMSIKGVPALLTDESCVYLPEEQWGDVAGSSTSRESIWRCTSASGYTILSYIWGFPDMEVPQIGRFLMENPINMDDLEVPLFQESPIYPTYGVYYILLP